MSTLAHTVERTIVLPAGPAEVWDAITDECLLGEWLADYVELDPREGGELRCRYEDGEERRGEVELVEEAERLAFHWQREGSGPSRVEFIVDAVAEGTRLRVIETSLAGPTMLAAAWAPRLRSLRLLLGRLVLA
ncbi:MAG TPA: SRPBCC domain-containing protein [Solirubrobacterales bacterium]